MLNGETIFLVYYTAQKMKKSLMQISWSLKNASGT